MAMFVNLNQEVLMPIVQDSETGTTAVTLTNTQWLIAGGVLLLLLIAGR